MLVEEALRDLQNRTLARLNGDFAKLVYLASTRDYNTGHYAHDGLSFRFSELVAERALAAAHREVFVSLALSPLRVLVGHLSSTFDPVARVRMKCLGPGAVRRLIESCPLQQTIP